MPRHTTPFASLPAAALFVTLFLTCWKVAAWVIGLTATCLLLCRLGRWVQANQAEVVEAVAGGLPFLLILLAVFQLK